MTAKRFKLGYVCGDYGLIDYEKPKGEQWIDLHCMSKSGYENVQICINKMNKLADENKQLKEEIKDLNDILARYEEKELEK